MIKGKMLGYVFLGGALGTLARYFIFELMAFLDLNYSAELISLFTVNLLGSYFLGLAARHPYFQLEWCRNLWGAGFAGGFTTMSALTLFVDSTALSWEIYLMLVLGVFAYGLGFRQGRLAKKKAENIA